MLRLKLERTYRIPEVREVLEDRAHLHGLKADNLAATTIRDSTLLNLPAISPKVPLETVLGIRDKLRDELGRARDKPAILASRIRDEPWSKELEVEIHRGAIPDLKQALDEAEKARTTGWTGRGASPSRARR